MNVVTRNQRHRTASYLYIRRDARRTRTEWIGMKLVLLVALLVQLQYKTAYWKKTSRQKGSYLNSDILNHTFSVATLGSCTRTVLLRTVPRKREYWRKRHTNADWPYYVILTADEIDKKIHTTCSTHQSIEKVSRRSLLQHLFSYSSLLHKMQKQLQKNFPRKLL